MIMAKDSNNNYVKIEDIITQQNNFNGISPIKFKSSGENLENYRIYGNTVGGESVGDRTGNLFDKSGSQYGNNLHWVPNFSLVYSDAYYGSPIMDVTGLNTITRSYTGTGANYFSTSDLSQFVNVPNIGTVDAGVTVNVPDGYTKYVFNIPNTIRPDSIMVNSGSTALPYEPYGYKVAVTVSNGTDTRTVPIYLPEQIRKVDDEAEYIDFEEQKQHFADGTSVDVTLPALPTLSGTNTLSVETNTKPSKVWGKLSDLRDILYVKDNLGNILFSKYHEIEGEPPLIYKSKKAGTLIDYRIYGQTVDGESVGDRTGNLFYKKIENANISSRGDVGTDSQYQYDLWIGKVTAGETYTARNMNLVVGFFTDEPDFGVYTYNNSRIADASPVYTFTVPSGCSYVVIRFFKNEPTIMLNSGSTALPYEPYGYKVPVTVSNGTDTLTTTIYLPEQIKKVGDEAEYIDYGEQKFHRISGADLDVTLPVLPTVTGTNVLSIGAEIQPSKINIKGKIKGKIYG